jgi:glycosyltransferase involved in cell wall biosynthesis
VLPDALRCFIVGNLADPAEIAEKLNALLEVRTGFAAAARRAAELLTWDDYGRQLLELLESL